LAELIFKLVGWHKNSMKPQAARQSGSRGIQRTSDVSSQDFSHKEHKNNCSPIDIVVAVPLSTAYSEVAAIRKICTSAVPRLSRSKLDRPYWRCPANWIVYADLAEYSSELSKVLIELRRILST
jgi:hypothetical protein